MTDSSTLPLSAKEKKVVLGRIQALMTYWDISPDELLESPAALTEPPPPAPAPTVKYRHPSSGETWDGVGSQPDWLRKALLSEGYTVHELRSSVEAANDR
jgi:DNA-binding protein H-NS